MVQLTWKFLIFFSLLQSFGFIQSSHSKNEVILCLTVTDTNSQEKYLSRIKNLDIDCVNKNKDDKKQFFCSSAEECEKLKKNPCITYALDSNISTFINAVEAYEHFNPHHDEIDLKTCTYSSTTNENVDRTLTEMHVLNHCKDIIQIITSSSSFSPDATKESTGYSLNFQELLAMYNDKETSDPKLFNESGLYNFRSQIAPQAIHLAGLNINSTGALMGALNIPQGAKYIQFVAPATSDFNNAQKNTLEELQSVFGQRFEFTAQGDYIMNGINFSMRRFALTYKEID